MDDLYLHVFSFLEDSTDVFHLAEALLSSLEFNHLVEDGDNWFWKQQVITKLGIVMSMDVLHNKARVSTVYLRENGIKTIRGRPIPIQTSRDLYRVYSYMKKLYTHDRGYRILELINNYKWAQLDFSIVGQLSNSTRIRGFNILIGPPPKAQRLISSRIGPSYDGFLMKWLYNAHKKNHQPREPPEPVNIDRLVTRKKEKYGLLHWWERDYPLMPDKYKHLVHLIMLSQPAERVLAEYMTLIKTPVDVDEMRKWVPLWYGQHILLLNDKQILHWFTIMLAWSKDRPKRERWLALELYDVLDHVVYCDAHNRPVLGSIIEWVNKKMCELEDGNTSD